MKSLPIPDTDQMSALLDGSILDLLREYIVDPPRWDFRKLLTIDRQKLIAFLQNNPVKTEAYFQKQKQSKRTHDVLRIWEEDGEYVVAWMDHENPRFPERFKSMAESVAQHVLVTYGMY
jgi:hypothetical protein